eukprot:8002314-Alexandrium_andersonii.AAC.1
MAPPRSATVAAEPRRRAKATRCPRVQSRLLPVMTMPKTTPRPDGAGPVPRSVGTKPMRWGL